MSSALKLATLAVVCSALLLQPAAAAGYSFNFGGGRMRLSRMRMHCSDENRPPLVLEPSIGHL